MDREVAYRRIEVRAQISSCTRCKLRSECTQPVPFRGPTPATLAVIGEAPGRQEDKTIQPFVGPAGQVLEECMLEAEIDPRQVFFCNVACCWPTASKHPDADHIAACKPNLVAQIRLADPKFVIVAGGVALGSMMPGAKISREHGRPFWHTFGLKNERGMDQRGVGCMPIYHPAAYLHKQDPEIRRWIVEDLTTLVAMLRVDESMGVKDGWTEVCTECHGREVALFDKWGRPWCEGCASDKDKMQRDERAQEMLSL